MQRSNPISANDLNDVDRKAADDHRNVDKADNDDATRDFTNIYRDTRV